MNVHSVIDKYNVDEDNTFSKEDVLNIANEIKIMENKTSFNKNLIIAVFGLLAVVSAVDRGLARMSRVEVAARGSNLPPIRHMQEATASFSDWIQCEAVATIPRRYIDEGVVAPNEMTYMCKSTNGCENDDSSTPSFIPSSIPSVIPSSVPSNVPSVIPSPFPSLTPTLKPSSIPIVTPSFTKNPSSVPSSTRAWLQVGEDIDGENAGDLSGYSVSLSDDGRSVAIGAYGNNDNGYYAGQCRVYSNNNDEGKWIQKGGDLDGEDAGDLSGWSVSISDDGNIVAVGALYNDGNGSNSGHVRVHKYDSQSMAWSQLGQDIDGQAAGDEFGASVSLAANGKSLVIGAPGNENGRGRVVIFKFDDVASKWVSFGWEIRGENAGDNFGRSVSMSKNGAVVAIGSPYNGKNGYRSGVVDMYLYNEDEKAWKRMGTAIIGDSGDQLGTSVSLSDDGKVVAIGSDGYNAWSGHTQMYIYDSSLSDWVQMGDDIVGEAAGDLSGRSVSLSADGTIVAIGADWNDGNDGNGSLSGHVRLFKYDGSEWSQIGDDIDGESAWDYSGCSVSLAGDGLTVAIGAYRNDGGGDSSGHVRMYKYAPE